MTFNNDPPPPHKMIKTKTKSNLQHNTTKRHPDKKNKIKQTNKQKATKYQGSPQNKEKK